MELPAALLWGLVAIGGPILLGIVIVVGALRRRRLAAARDNGRTTAAPYGAEELLSPPVQNLPDGQRPTEDDIVRAKFGPRGVPGEPDVSRMTPQRAKKTPAHLDPGHTA
jgi:hypothetical protein